MNTFYELSFMNKEQKEEKIPLHDVHSDEKAIEDGLRMLKRNQADACKIYKVEDKKLFGFVSWFILSNKKLVFDSTVESAKKEYLL